MDKGGLLCTYCDKKCSTFDSRPVNKHNPSSRIHNRCALRKKPAICANSAKECGDTIAESQFKQSEPVYIRKGLDLTDVREPSKRELINRLTIERKLEQPGKSVSIKPKGQFFFDLDAGVAKPHEVKQYLNYKNKISVGESFDDNGFKVESSSRGYDNRGKDILDGSSNSSTDSEDDFISIKTKVRQEEKPPKPHTSVLDFGGGTRERHDQVRSQDRSQRAHKPSDVENRTRVKPLDKPCWFCLSTPQCEKNLVVSVGNQCYLALDKGGLTEDHMLILPIDHIRSTNDITDNTILEEIDKFKSALTAFHRERDHDVIFFERNFRSVHFQIHAVPVPKHEHMDELIKKVSMEVYPRATFLPLLKSGIGDTVPRTSYYFMWHMEPSGSKIVLLFNTKESFFPLQFGREVLTHETILNMRDRIDWKRCLRADIDDAVAKIRQNFSQFDFTLDDE